MTVQAASWAYYAALSTCLWLALLLGGCIIVRWHDGDCWRAILSLFLAGFYGAITVALILAIR